MNNDNPESSKQAKLASVPLCAILVIMVVLDSEHL